MNISEAEFHMKIRGDDNLIEYRMVVDENATTTRTVVITTDYPEQLSKCLEPFCDFIHLLIQRKEEEA